MEKYKNTGAFQVPEHYFEQLPDAVLHQIQCVETLRAQKSEKTFQVPEGYFAGLPAAVLQRIQQKQQRAAFIRRRLTIGISAAASVLLLLGAGFFFHNQMSGESAAPVLVQKQQQRVATIAARAEQPVLLAAVTQESSETLPQVHRRPIRTARSVQTDDVEIGDFSASELNSIDYELLDLYSDDNLLGSLMDLEDEI